MRLQWVMHSRSVTSIFVDAVVVPILFIGATYFLSDKHLTARQMLGAGLAGYWSTTFTQARAGMLRQRMSGVLEGLIAAPTPIWIHLLGSVSANAVIAWISLAVAYASALLLGTGAQPEWTLALPVLLAFTVAAVAFGAALSLFYLLYRVPYGITNLLELMGWLLCGVVFPITLLPIPLQWLGRLLPFTWATEALDQGGHWRLMVSFGISFLYLALGQRLYRLVEYRLRVSGTVSHG
jgi:ABC-2 type transport system permease protein